MKVDFLNFDYTKHVAENTPKQANKLPFSTVRKNVNLSDMCFVPFTGVEVVADKSLEALKGVHCPSCGIKMLSLEEFNSILEKAKNISSTEDFLSVLNEHYESIQHHLKGTVKFFNKLAKSRPGISIEGIITITKAGCNTNLHNVISSQIELLEAPLKFNVSYQDRELLRECAEVLKNSDKSDKGVSKNEYKDIILGYVSQLKALNKWEIYDSLKSQFMRAYDKRSVLSSYSEDENMLAHDIISNILRPSISHTNKINDKMIKDMNSNKILLCGDCSKRKHQAISQIIKEPDDEHLSRYGRYLEDIASKVVSGETDINYLYLTSLNSNLKRLSKGDIFIVGAPSMSELKHQKFLEHARIDFKLVDADGIPCACCGKDTITHAHRLRIFEELDRTNNNYDRLLVLRKNEDIIRDLNLPIVNDIAKYVEENPNISDTELLQAIRVASTRRIKLQLTDNINYLQEQIKSDVYSQNDVILIKSFINEVKEKFLSAKDGKNFQWQEYVNVLIKTINNMENEQSRKLYEYLKYNIKDIFVTEQALYPLPMVVARYDSPMKVVSQNIIKASVATKDHAVARAKAGSDDEDNILILCKQCNKNKGSLGFFNWFKRDKRVQKNLPKYFEVISNKVKNGELSKKAGEYLEKLQIRINELLGDTFKVDY